MTQKYNELVYMVIDLLKIESDDSIINEGHIVFLLNKYRAFLLKQKYLDIRKQMHYSNYLTLKLELKKEALEINPSIIILKCDKPIPLTLNVGKIFVYDNPFNKDKTLTLVDRLRFPYTTISPYMHTIKYCSIMHGNIFYVKSKSSNLEGLSELFIDAVFEDPILVFEFQNDDTDILELDFPLESPLINTALEMVLKELTPKVLSPQDTINNENDDLNPSDKSND